MEDRSGGRGAVAGTVQATTRVSQKINLRVGGWTSSMHALLKKKKCHSTCQYIIGVLVGGIVESLFPLVLVQELKWRSSCRKKKAWESVVVILRLHPKTELLSEL